MNTQPSSTTGVELNPVPSPVELVEKDHSGFSAPTVLGPSPLGSGCVRVFATSWPYIGHSPPLVGGFEHGAAASAVDVKQIAESASARGKHRRKMTLSACWLAGLVRLGSPPARRARRLASIRISVASRLQRPDII